MSVAEGHGTMAPDESLHFRVIGSPYSVDKVAFEATAADQINCEDLV